MIHSKKMYKVSKTSNFHRPHAVHTLLTACETNCDQGVFIMSHIFLSKV